MARTRGGKRSNSKTPLAAQESTSHNETGSPGNHRKPKPHHQRELGLTSSHSPTTVSSALKAELDISLEGQNSNLSPTTIPSSWETELGRSVDGQTSSLSPTTVSSALEAELDRSFRETSPSFLADSHSGIESSVANRTTPLSESPVSSDTEDFNQEVQKIINKETLRVISDCLESSFLRPPQGFINEETWVISGWSTKGDSTNEDSDDELDLTGIDDDEISSYINRELIEAINQAEGILHDTESKMEEFKDQLPSEDAAKMKEQIAEVKEKMKNKDDIDPEEIKKTVGDLQQSSLKLFEMAYKKMASEKESSGSSSSEEDKKEDKS